MTQPDLFPPTGPRPLRIKANGYDVTDRMPLTLAELERQRPKSAGANDTLSDPLGCHNLRPQTVTPDRSIRGH